MVCHQKRQCMFKLIIAIINYYCDDEMGSHSTVQITIEHPNTHSHISGTRRCRCTTWTCPYMMILFYTLYRYIILYNVSTRLSIVQCRVGAYVVALLFSLQLVCDQCHHRRRCYVVGSSRCRIWVSFQDWPLYCRIHSNE